MTFEQWITGQRERGQVPFGTAYELFSRKAFDAGVAAERERCAVTSEKLAAAARPGEKIDDTLRRYGDVIRGA